MGQNAYAGKKRLRTSDFVKSQYLSGVNSKLKLLLSKEDIAISDLSKNNTITLHLDASDLLKKENYPQSIVIKAYTLDNNNQSTLVNSISSTIFNNKQAKGFLAEIELPLDFTSSDLYFDIFDTNNNLAASFKRYIEVDSSIADLERNKLTTSECSGDEFGECQIKYLLDNVKFESIPSRDAEVELLKETSGKYTVRIPLVRTKRFKVGVVDSGETNTKQVSQVVNSGIFDFINNGIKVASVKWNETKEALDYLFNGDTTVFSIAKSGKVSVGEVEAKDAFLNIRSGDGDIAPIKLESGSLTNDPVDGAIEYDGSQFYLTSSGTRTAINTQGVPGTPGAPGPQGPAGPAGPQGPAGADGSFDGGDSDINGTLSFLSNGTLQDANFNGTISIPTGAANGYVFTSDAAGNGAWASLGSVVNGSSLNLNSVVASAFSNPNGCTQCEQFGAGTSSSNYSVVIGQAASATQVASTVIGKSARSSASYGIAIGREAVVDSAAHYSIAIGGRATNNIPYSLLIGGTTQQLRDVYIGNGPYNSSPLDITYHGTGGSGTDVNGASLILAAGLPTGAGSGGDLIFQTANGGSSGSTVTDLHERMRITQAGTTIINGALQYLDGNQTNGYVLTSDANGLATWQEAPGASSGVAGAIQFSDGANGMDSNATNLFWDDTNQRLGIQTNAPDYDLHLKDGVLAVEGTGSVGGIPTRRALYLFQESATTANIQSRADHISWKALKLDGGQIAFNSISGGRTDFNGVNIDTDSRVSISTSGATKKGFVVKASSGQSANLTEWQDVNGDNLSYVDSSGDFYLGTNSLRIGAYDVNNDVIASGERLKLQSNTGAFKGIELDSPTIYFNNSNANPYGTSLSLAGDVATWQAKRTTEIRIGIDNNPYDNHNGKSITLSAQNAEETATTYTDGGHIYLYGGNGSSASVGDADGGNVYLMPGDGFGTGSNGNVGISTTTPLAKLHVNGSLMIADGTESDGYVLTSDANGLATWQAAAGGGGGSASGVAGAVQFSDGSSSFSSNASELFWDNANGSLGIGTNTPGASLNIWKAQTATETDLTQATNNAAILINSLYSSGSYLPGITWTTDNNNPSKPKSGIYSYTTNFGSGLIFGTSGSYSTGINRKFEITDRGSVKWPDSSSYSYVPMYAPVGDDGFGFVTSAGSAGELNAGKISLDSSFWSDPDATLDVHATNSTTIGQIIKGASGQSVSLQEWQDSNGNAMSIVDTDGFIEFKDSKGIRFSPGTSTNILRSYSSQYEAGTLLGTRYPMILELISSGALEIKNSSGTNIAAFGGDGTIALTGDVGFGAISSADVPVHARNLSAANSAAIFSSADGNQHDTNWEMSHGTVTVENYNSSTGNETGVLFYDGSSNQDLAWVGAKIINSDDDGQLGFATANGGTLDLAMLIDQSGNIGISTTTPSAKLHVNGTAMISDELTLSKGLVFTTSSAVVNSGASLSLDFTDYHIQKITLDDNVTSVSITDPNNMAYIKLIISQDATGNRTLTGWPAEVKWPGGTAPTLSTAANAVDIIDCFFDDTNYFCKVDQNFQ